MASRDDTSTIGQTGTRAVERIESAGSQGGTTQPPPASISTTKRRLTKQQAAMRWTAAILAFAATALGVWLWMPPLWLVAVILWVIFAVIVMMQKRPAAPPRTDVEPHPVRH